MDITTVETTTENAQFFVALKTAIAAMGTGFTVAFGWVGWLVAAWFACMALDYITGSIAAAKSGTWASALAREGSFHKAGMIVVVLIAGIADAVLSMMLQNVTVLSFTYSTALLPLILVWYIFTELGSIAENAIAMGAPVPSFLTTILATAAAAAESAGDSVAETTGSAS